MAGTNQNLINKLMLEERERRLNALAMFRPAEQQEPVVRQMAKDGWLALLLGGGQRCLAGCQEIYDPVRDVSQRVDSIEGEFHVWSRDPVTGERIIAKASKPFVKGYDQFYELSLSNGESIIVTGQHRFLLQDGSWGTCELVVRGGTALSSVKTGVLSSFPRGGDGKFANGHSTDAVTVVSSRVHSEGPVWDFEVPETGNYECAGVLSHNSGKTVLAACCMASMMLNQPITFNSGEQIHLRPERWRQDPMKFWFTGYDHKHIGKTIFRVLFKPDLFKIIRDQRTGRWRSYNPENPEDAGEDIFKLTRPSPPLIRPAHIQGGWDGVSWENKKERQISSCELIDGTRLEFFASTGALPTGDPAHMIWADERFEDDRWIDELLMRLVDYRGHFLWTAWPNTEPSEAMSKLQERAERQKGDPDATSFYFRLEGGKNPYTKSDFRDKVLDTMDEANRLARDLGILNMDRWRVYPRFSPYVHRVLGPDPSNDDPLAAAVRKVNGIPPDWTRYWILDPGTANPAVLFVAIPPPHLGDFIVPYDEIYVHGAHAEPLMKMVKEKMGKQVFEDFIADSHACAQTPMGFAGSVGDNYRKEMAKLGISCRRRGCGFSWGADGILPRIMRLQSTMQMRSNGTPRLRIMTDSCKDLCKQLELYKWKKGPDGNPSDKPNERQMVDLAVALEYLVSRDDCGYVKPPLSTPADMRSPKVIAMAIAKELGMDKVKAKQQTSVYCGPGAPKW